MLADEPPLPNVTDQPSQGSTMLRAIAVGNRINLAAAATEASYCAELERIVELAVPHLAPDGGPNLLVLTEMLGLPAALTGPQGDLARRAPTASAALTLLALAWLPRILRIRRRWPGVSLARALLLARADALYRPIATMLSRLAATHSTHIVATTLVPHGHYSSDPAEIARWGCPGAACVFLPDAQEVYNAALVFGPNGHLLERIDKVYLTHSERAVLDLTPGKLADVRVVPTIAGRLGIAISLDAFTPSYLRHLDAQAAEIVVQPDANDQLWAAPSATCHWQPAEWLNSVLGSIQPQYPHLRYNICAMQTGNFFDLPFDGQSSITARYWGSNVTPTLTFIGVDDHRHTVTGESLIGSFVALAPWVTPDPIAGNPALTLPERRERLHETARSLLPNHANANAYRESVVWADLPIRSSALAAV